MLDISLFTIGGKVITILIPVLIGAVIGYITNYLAIRMLFRPLEAKYLFGVKLPFTPGLIPKEQDRLAQRTGQAVKEYLLTEEAVLLHLESANALGRLQTAVQDFLQRETAKSTTIGQVLEERAQLSPASLSPAVSRFLVKNRFFGWADPETARARVRTAVSARLRKNADRPEPLLEAAKEWIAGAVREGSLDLAASEAVLDFFAAREDLNLEEALPEPLLLGLLAQYNEREEDLVLLVKRLLLSARMTATVRAAAQDTAAQHMSRALQVFLRPEGVGSRVAEAYASYMESEDSAVLLRENLRGALETLLQSRVGDLFAPVSEEKAAGWARELLEGGVVLLHKESVSNALQAALVKNEAFLSDSIGHLAAGVLADSLGKLDTAKTAEIVAPFLVKFFETRTSDVVKSFGDDAPEMLAQHAADLLRTVLPGLVKDGVARFGVDTLVEEQIRRFDVKMLEDVIIDVADRELKAITNLGALLGALMGLIQPLLQRFL